jgi:hypothetical protein
MFFGRRFQAELVELGTKVIGLEQYMGTTTVKRMEAVMQQQFRKIHMTTSES